ncbi:hypothetical protein CFR77_13065 [Komagataeibacter sucrofermentans]|uniref:Uncharacterized protein n=2 Tax=Komagataeibacter sucrofermentans TaxID=1053551 RepID=A0A318QEH8_9PROT|nr:hypothetical protein CFR77_13065 [Komagataeibacter sucrofermentans]
MVATLSGLWDEMRLKLAQAIKAYNDNDITLSDLKAFLREHRDEIDQLPQTDLKLVADWMNARSDRLDGENRAERANLENIRILTDAWADAHGKGVTEGLERAIRLGGLGATASRSGPHFSDRAISYHLT